jgi:hypothetical protein
VLLAIRPATAIGSYLPTGTLRRTSSKKFSTKLAWFCTDGAAPNDNNASEREMKRVVLSRKNSLFAGDPRGGRTAAILASLTFICRRHEIDLQLYLTRLLLNLPSWPARDLDAWLPDQWKLRQAARLAALQDTAITDS